MTAVKNLVLGLALVGLTTEAAMAQQGLQVLHPDGPYTQAVTGMTYPVSVGAFQRVDIIRYNPDGSDESAGYNRYTPGTEIGATVYVFPSPSLASFGSSQAVMDDARARLCDSQFRSIQKEVTDAHPDAVLVSQGDTRLVQGGAAHAGHQAFYMLTNANFFGRVQVPSRSDVYVFCYAGGKWTVEYRIDYPVVHDASAAIAAFMQDLNWTIPVEK